jgi:hypothetical protein
MSQAFVRGAYRVIKYLMRFDILLCGSITGVMNGGEGEHVLSLAEACGIAGFSRRQSLGW